MIKNKSVLKETLNMKYVYAAWTDITWCKSMFSDEISVLLLY